MPEIEIIKCSLDVPKFQEFYAKWESDILNFHPDFELESADLGVLLTVTTGGVIIGLFFYQTKGDEIHIEIDYVIPAFRNKGIGAKLFDEQIEKFKKDGYTSIYATAGNPMHADYLIQHDFKKTIEHSELFKMTL